MKFTKMHGAGNDFILIDNRNGEISREAYPALAARLCSRRISLGADGLMVIENPENGGDYKMAFYNSDGTLGEMCGNGARCICRYGHDRGLAGDVQHVETTAGLVIGERITERQYRVRINDPSVIRLHRSALGYDCAYVEIGSPGLPHAVVLMDDFDSIDENELREKGRALRYFEGFPKGANVDFCRITGKDTVKAVTFERGVEDFTLACGTGASSVVAVLTLMKLVSGKNVTVSMPGGDLNLSVTEAEGSIRDIFLTGPTNVVAVGEITDEDM